MTGVSFFVSDQCYKINNTFSGRDITGIFLVLQNTAAVQILKKLQFGHVALFAA